MKMDVGTNKNYVTLFVNLFEVAEKWNKDAGLQIDRTMLDQGYAVYAFSTQEYEHRPTSDSCVLYLPRVMNKSMNTDQLLVRGPGFDTRSGNILSFLLPLIQEG